jgi:hypothetical protein
MILFKGRCVPDVTITGAWMVEPLNTLYIALSTTVDFYPKAKALPVPADAKCYNSNEGHLCTEDWNEIPAVAEGKFQELLLRLSPKKQEIVRRMIKVNTTQPDNEDPDLELQIGFASPFNVMKKLWCNRDNLFGDHQMTATNTTTALSINRVNMPAFDDLTLTKCPGLDAISLAQVLGPDHFKIGRVIAIACTVIETNKTL